MTRDSVALMSSKRATRSRRTGRSAASRPDASTGTWHPPPCRRLAPKEGGRRHIALVHLPLFGFDCRRRWAVVGVWVGPGTGAGDPSRERQATCRATCVGQPGQRRVSPECTKGKVDVREPVSGVEVADREGVGVDGARTGWPAARVGCGVATTGRVGDAASSWWVTCRRVAGWSAPARATTPGPLVEQRRPCLAMPAPRPSPLAPRPFVTYSSRCAPPFVAASSSSCGPCDAARRRARTALPAPTTMTRRWPPARGA